MKKIFSPRVLNITFLVIFFISWNNDSPAQSSKQDTTIKSFRLFEDDKPVEITLRFDLTSYFRTKPKEEYLKANITFHISQTDSINKDIRLRTRGIFRNQYCFFAPIELNFKKVDFGYTDLNRITKIKLVPQCNSGKENGDYVLREYLIYKLFNVLTDTSFRVRLLTINYIDTEKKRKPIRQNGFFIEPVDMLTVRTNSVQIKTHNLTQKSIVPKVMDRFALFNYMIGNYDWAVLNQHNVLIIKPLVYESSGLGIAIPHDFDWTGLVNAAYAIPAEIVGTQNVRERLFLGVCRSKEVYLKDLDIFLNKKAAFYRVINEFPYLNQSAKKDMTGYLDGFFDQLTGKKDNMLYYLLNSCKNF
jgi:hypothetical protein